MKALLTSEPHPDTVIKIELSMTYKEAKDMYKAVNQTNHWPIGFLQNLFIEALRMHVTEVEKSIEVQG